MLIRVFLVVLLAAIPCAADTLYVAATASSGGDGESWKAPFTSIGEALARGQTGDEIWCAAGTYSIPSEGYGVTNGVHLYGGFTGTETLREQRDWYRQRTVLRSSKGANIFTLNQCDSITRIDGFVLQGTIDCAVRINGGAPRIFNNHFLDCTSLDNGAAIRMNGGGRVQIEYCVFEKCASTALGGAVYLNTEVSSAAWSRQWGGFIGQSFFVDFRAVRGGGLFVSGSPGTTQVVSSVFVGNRATLEGGALGSDSSDLYINNVTFYNNDLLSSVGRGGKTLALYAGLIQNSLIWNGDDDTTTHVKHVKPLSDTTAKLSGRANVIERDFDYGFWQFEPDFVNRDDVNGPDDIYGTDDDGLYQLATSIGRDGGYLDGYVNHRQHDIVGNPRLVGRKVDVGAYESQREGRMGYREVMNEMRKGGLVFMYRHGKTDWDQKDKGPAPECFPGRNLIAEGREQCAEIGKAQRMLGVPQGEAFSSPACRCWETLKLMVGRYEVRSYWAGGGGGGQTGQSRIRDLSTPVPSGNRFISTHDAVCQAIYNGYGTGELITTAEFMEGDALIVRPLGGTENEILAHWCSENWTRYHVRFPEITVDVHNDAVVDALTVYPVPASDIVRLTTTQSGTVRIVDLVGSVVAEMHVDASAPIAIDVSAWMPGAYIVQSGNQSARFMVLR